MQDIELPGGKKLPGWVLLAGGAVVVLFLVLRKSPEEDEGIQGDLLASELDQRLQEMQEQLQAALDSASQQPPTDQTTPPAQPVEITPPDTSPSYPTEGTPGGLAGLPYVAAAPSVAPVSVFNPAYAPESYTITPLQSSAATLRTGAPVGTVEAHKTRRKLLGIPEKREAAPVGTEKAAATRTALIQGAKPETELKTITKKIKKKAAREKTSPVLKQAPATAQKLKITKKGPTIKKGRKR